jgi:hypothetical protein
MNHDAVAAVLVGAVKFNSWSRGRRLIDLSYFLKKWLLTLRARGLGGPFPSNGAFKEF